MPLIVQAEYSASEIYGVGAAESLSDLTPEQQLDVICAEFAKPKKLQTVRRKLAAYWTIISAWREDRPDLFDAALYEFVSELENRHASAPDGIGHLRSIANTETSE